MNKSKLTPFTHYRSYPVLVLAILIFALLFGPSVPVSQAEPLSGTISDGTVSFQIYRFTDTSAGASYFFTVSSKDQMYGGWWWYRISGDTKETKFPAPNAETYVGNVATLTWTNVNNRGFSATLTYTVKDLTGGKATLQQDMTITNNSGGNLQIDMFVLADTTVAGDDENDSATLSTANHIISVSDGGTTVKLSSNFVTQGKYMAGAVYAALQNNSVTNFSNTGLPVTGDVGFGFQDATRTIPNGSSVTYTAGYGVNTTAPTAITLEQLRCPEQWHAPHGRHGPSGAVAGGRRGRGAAQACVAVRPGSPALVSCLFPMHPLHTQQGVLS